MPFIEVNGARLHYLDEGQGVPIVFAHGLCFSTAMYQPQVDALRDDFRCIRFDFRGQGRSEVTESGYDMDTLSEDAASLIEALGAAPCHFVGLSMGGFVGLRLAIRRPQLLRSLTLLDSSAQPEVPAHARAYRRLNFIARWFGLRPVIGRAEQILYGQSVLQDAARAEELARWRAGILASDRIGLNRAVVGVIEREGVEADLHKIDLPVLIAVGEEDVATTPDKSRFMHEQIRGSRMQLIQGAGHTPTLEQPEAVTQLLRQFFDHADAHGSQGRGA